MLRKAKKHLFSVFYILVMALVVFAAWNDQAVSRRRGESPLYRNLMDYPAFVRRGFDLDEIKNLSADYRELSTDWHRYEGISRTIRSSSLPDLPKRAFLSPLGNEAQVFTMIFLLEMDGSPNGDAISFLKDNPAFIPGINFANIGENWEVYFNGALVQSGMYYDPKGRLENRTWRNVYFSFERTLIVPGTNILALKIIGDPSYVGTGLAFRTHHYIDDFKTIQRRQHNFPLITICIICGFAGIIYLMFYFSSGKRSGIYNLYFGIFSVLVCIYALTRHSIVNILIPNADISIRLEYFSVMLLIPVFCIFIESLVRGAITRASYYYLGYCFLLSFFQFFFCKQFGEDIISVWNITSLFYVTYFLFYKLIYYCYKNRGKNRKESAQSVHVVIALVGMAGLYVSAVYETLELILLRNDINIFQYCVFAVHIGMAYNLAMHFSGMNKKLEQTIAALNELQKIKAQSVIVKIGLLSFDLVTSSAFYDDNVSKKRDLLLSPKEFALLYLLARSGASGGCEGETLSARHLYEAVWNNPYSGTANATIRTHIAYLKKKIDAVTDEIILESTRGEGYRLIFSVKFS